ncbi:lipase family protein [Nocardia sp. NPDC059180]|uniref:lipase family protein n=1 Tax=Nocardia sp. NPDC059180 TaxID=3346761 RepID=UPI003694AF6B
MVVLNGVVPGVIGGAAPGLIGYVLNGMVADYPDIAPLVHQTLNDAGRTMLAEVATTCVAETGLRTMFRPTTFYANGARATRQNHLATPAAAEPGSGASAGIPACHCCCARLDDPALRRDTSPGQLLGATLTPPMRAGVPRLRC